MLKTRIAFVATSLLLTFAVVMFTGCIGTMAQLMYVIKGHDVPAAYNGLVGKRTAIVCVSDASAYGPDTLTNTVARAVGMKLGSTVKKIEIVPHANIEKWIDVNGWDELDFTALGKGVSAERVVAIEIASYSIHEGPTIYKGRANVTVTVYDLENKKGPTVAYTYQLQDYEFPKNGRPAIQSNDRQFEAFFLARMTRQICDQFIKHDRLATFADEAMLGE